MKDILTKKYQEIWLIAAIVSISTALVVLGIVLLFWNSICLQVVKEVIKMMR